MAMATAYRQTTPTRIARAGFESSDLSDDGIQSLVWRWLTAALDELDYGIVLLCDGRCVVHINHVARVELDDHALQLLGNELSARSVRDAMALNGAIAAAASRGLRGFLTLGTGRTRSSVSIVPLETTETGPYAVLVLLAKRSASQTLSIAGFARAHQLTAAESRVLEALCKGSSPQEVAIQHGVAISTVRSQITSIRRRTGASDIRALLQQIAVLPPINGALRTAA